jgi:hypothetical protein
VIGLLIEEYRTLREEVIQRLNGRVQLLAFAIAGAGIAASGKSPVFYGALGGSLLLVGMVFWNRSKRGIEYLASHIARLERCINELSSRAYGTRGQFPFQWETEQARIRTRARWWARRM